MLVSTDSERATDVQGIAADPCVSAIAGRSDARLWLPAIHQVSRLRSYAARRKPSTRASQALIRLHLVKMRLSVFPNPGTRPFDDSRVIVGCACCLPVAASLRVR